MKWSAILVLALLLTACRTPLPVAGMRIEGNRFVDRDDLIDSAKRHLEAYRANDGRLADADDAAYAMESFLRGEGHPEARVRFAVEGSQLVFRVQEGPRATFRRVRFEGVRSVSEDDLRPFFDFEGDGILGFGATRLDPAKVESAVSSVQDLYLERGYRRVDVAPPKLDWSADRRFVDVVVQVDEGPQYRVSGVSITGASETLIAGEDVVGKPYRQGLPFQMAGRVRRKLKDDGYALAQVRGTTEIDDDRASAQVRIDVDLGEPTRLRNLEIRGNHQTNTDFIRRRFDFRQGDVIRRAQFERGIADLYRSRLFSRVGTELKPVGTNQADLVVDVKEANTKRLDLEAGWGSWEQLRGSAEYKDFNLFGWGRILRATALASMKSYGGEVEIEDPWILGQDNRLWWNISAMHREERFYDYTGFGTELGFEHRFARQSRVWGGYRFRLEEGDDIDADIPPDVLEEVEGFQRSAGLFLSARYDTRDDRFLPTQGWFLEGGTFWSTGPLGASLNFLELEGRATYHLGLGKFGVLAFGTRAASRKPFGGTVLPIQQRYFLGGQFSVRSYGQDELTPLSSNGQGIGGLTAIEGHVEWRRQIYDIFHGALFYDAGLVSEDPFSLDGIFGYGVGAGLRLYTPVGPVRLDVGYNPGYLYAADNRWQFFFSFGFSF